MTIEMVCAWCDVYCREAQVTTDTDGRVVDASTVCSYCGRSELRFGKLGRQTPLPEEPNVVNGPWDTSDILF